jgi:3-deoxy-D-manno-octulosonic-acid transferase
MRTAARIRPTRYRHAQRLAGGLYNAALYALLPLLLGRLVWRGVTRDGDYLRQLAQRFGWIPAQPDTPSLWIHAVSVGEVRVAAPLVRELMTRHPGHRIVVTTTTPTGARELRQLFGGQVTHAWLPFDLPGATARFVRRLAPDAGVLIETEVWPNLCRACRRAGVPLALMNGRLSAASVRRYARVRPLMERAFADLALVITRDRASARRFHALRRDRPVTVTGDMRFDVVPTERIRAAGRAFRERLGTDRPVWIAGSTHPDEEEAALAAHRQLRAAIPDAVLVLVPRHPGRDGVDAGRSRAHGFVTACRSTREAIPADAAVVLGDVLGELPWLYAAADAAFVGGSLVAIGGHNPVEPAALGLPILVGPHRQHFEATYRVLLAAGAATAVDGAADIAARIEHLLTHEPRRRESGHAARQIAAAHRGVTRTNADLLRPFIPTAEPEHPVGRLATEGSQPATTATAASAREQRRLLPTAKTGLRRE